MELRVWYFYNSIFAVETAAHFFIFDYFPYPGEPSQGGLAQGRLNLEELQDRDVVAFASHGHYDHFDECIFSWRGTIPKLRYVLSDDIKIPAALSGSDIVTVKARGEYDLGDLSVRTLHSTDLGVAFLIRTQGLTLYHGGDLNWWKWEGESDAYNAQMGEDYRREIDSLQNPEIDLAFVPLDGRLEQNYALGLDYFMRHTRTHRVVPMHFRDDYSVFARLKNEPCAGAYLDRVQTLDHPGQSFSILIER